MFGDPDSRLLDAMYTAIGGDEEARLKLELLCADFHGSSRLPEVAESLGLIGTTVAR